MDYIENICVFIKKYVYDLCSVKQLPDNNDIEEPLLLYCENPDFNEYIQKLYVNMI